MFKRILNSFSSSTVNDPFFGEVEMQQNKDDGTYYLEKNFRVEFLSRNIYFTIETSSHQATQLQFDTFVIIQKNLQEFCDKAMEKFENDYGNASGQKRSTYQLEAFYIPPDTTTTYRFELSFLNMTDGFSLCVVEFKNAEPTHIYFDA